MQSFLKLLPDLFDRNVLNAFSEQLRGLEQKVFAGPGLEGQDCALMVQPEHQIREGMKHGPHFRIRLEQLLRTQFEGTFQHFAVTLEFPIGLINCGDERFAQLGRAGLVAKEPLDLPPQ